MESVLGGWHLAAAMSLYSHPHSLLLQLQQWHQSLGSRESWLNPGWEKNGKIVSSLPKSLLIGHQWRNANTLWKENFYKCGLKKQFLVFGVCAMFSFPCFQSCHHFRTWAQIFIYPEHAWLLHMFSSILILFISSSCAFHFLALSTHQSRAHCKTTGLNS